jgi:multidrug transporter EmrE-like cation transporter
MDSNTWSMRWNSDMKNIQYFSLILLSILFQSISGIFGKYAALTSSQLSLLSIFSNTFFLLNLMCLFFQAIVWQQALIHFPLSFAYPFLSLVNFIILFLSAILFHEEVTVANIIGLVLISVGLSLLSRKSMGRSL